MVMVMGHQLNRIYEFGHFRLDFAERLLLRNGETIPLQPKAFDLLLVLVQNRGRLLGKEELLKVVWPDTIVEEVNLANNISVLRKALAEDGNGQRFIETVPRNGYRFLADDRAVNDESVIVAYEQPRSEIAIAPESASSTGVVAANHATSNTDRLSGAIRYNRRGMIGALAALGVIAVIAFGLYQSARQRQSRTIVSTPDPKVIPFTSLPGCEGEPAFSPDGYRIAFVWRRSENDDADIYVKQIGAEGLLRLTVDPAEDVGPTWSPDGRYIAFLRRAPTGSGIYLVPALGGGERKLADVFSYPGWSRIHRSPQGSPHWSPDGQFLAIADKGTIQEPFSIFLLASETGEKRRLTSLPAGSIGDFSPVFSPDGQTLAFVRMPSVAVTDLYLVPVGGGQPKRLTFINQFIGRVTWTPDGRELIFSSGGGMYGGSLWRVSASGGSPQRVVAAGQQAIDPAIAPKGERLAFGQTLIDSNIWRIDLTNAKRQSNARKMVISSTYQDLSPQYSPDGRKIVFSSDRAGGFEIWVCNSDGEHPIQLTNLDAHTGTPRWSPDGKSIVFDSRRDGNADIYIISAEGGTPTRLTTDPSEDITPSWSQDGRSIYFGSTRSGSLQIWRMPAGGGEAVQVTRQGGFEGFESPDGRFFYYAKGRGIPGIWRIPVEGGAETPVLDLHQAGLWRSWAVVERGIYFVTAKTRGRSLIEFFSFATGQVTPVAAPEKPIFGNTWGLAVSPDSQWLLFTQIAQQSNDIMLMENFL